MAGWQRVSRLTVVVALAALSSACITDSSTGRHTLDTAASQALGMMPPDMQALGRSVLNDVQNATRASGASHQQSRQPQPVTVAQAETFAERCMREGNTWDTSRNICQLARPDFFGAFQAERARQREERRIERRAIAAVRGECEREGGSWIVGEGICRPRDWSAMGPADWAEINWFGLDKSLVDWSSVDLSALAHACDRLAGHPEDPGLGGAAGVYWDSIDRGRAPINTCGPASHLAAGNHPDGPRLLCQYGRALYHHAERVPVERRHLWPLAIEVLEQSIAGGHDFSRLILGTLLADIRTPFAYSDPDRGLSIVREMVEHGGYDIAWFSSTISNNDLYAWLDRHYGAMTALALRRDDIDALASLAGSVVQGQRTSLYPLAKQHLDVAVGRGNAIGLTNLGLMYDYGRGVDVDQERARALYRRAADLGDEQARRNLVELDRGPVGQCDYYCQQEERRRRDQEFIEYQIEMMHRAQR